MVQEKLWEPLLPESIFIEFHLSENVATSLIDKNAASIFSGIGNRIMHKDDQDQTNK